MVSIAGSGMEPTASAAPAGGEEEGLTGLLAGLEEADNEVAPVVESAGPLPGQQSGAASAAAAPPAGGDESDDCAGFFETDDDEPAPASAATSPAPVSATAAGSAPPELACATEAAGATRNASNKAVKRKRNNPAWMTAAPAACAPAAANTAPPKSQSMVERQMEREFEADQLRKRKRREDRVDQSEERRLPLTDTWRAAAAAEVAGGVPRLTRSLLFPERTVVFGTHTTPSRQYTPLRV